MPISTFLIWPALHLMYGVLEHRSNKINRSRKISGRIVLLISAILIPFPLGYEHGFFFWLFALMAAALCFVQARVWQPKAVTIITLISSGCFVYQGVSYVL